MVSGNQYLRAILFKNREKLSDLGGRREWLEKVKQLCIRT